MTATRRAAHGARDQRAPEAAPDASVLVVVARQAIFTADLDLFAHELLFRASEGSQTSELTTVEDHDAATSHILSATFADFDPEEISGGLPLFVNLTRAFVVGDLPLLAGADRMVLEITEDIPMDDAVLAGMERLRGEGYALALDDFDGEDWRLPALPLVEYVKLVLEPERRERVGELVELVRREAPSAKIVVERIETDEDLDLCLALGVELLQGYGLERPKTLTAKTLQSSQLVALQLIAALTNPETHLRDVERLVENDPGLSMRVLRAASSSMVASTSKVSSVRQAMVLLGPKPLTSWATLTALSPTGSSSQQRVVMTHVLHRASACALMVPSDPHTAYTAGLLSATAEVVGVSPEELLADVNVAESVRAAVVDHAGEVGEALKSLMACENRVPGQQIDGVDDRTASAYLQALKGAMDIANSLAG
ncbi:EAL and modified HD-GYP domain-containing signal transduction protein [Quadrisphaera granulorum]|uniref:EAL and modified HD-GYP domain-containing signal transduction protein n=1 Tax=Quadrisphaera granulorum TaxID=317664 RepID=A0A316A4X8_9ACTN|nr:HDOD domain-containing protein [Quadrisphaera granulorum]PWJ52599.1 EAL and modified HD-GYP domain-containing signal transduction protein [Quadrisphaera granulorum]SZE97649.1 EAL and modified HD-GYP domain-containing signal transduction protein [Quadrisphaera granulorum]